MSTGSVSQAMADQATTWDDRVTLVAPDGNPVQIVVQASPNRTMLRVYGRVGGALVGLLLPDQKAIAALAALTVPAPIEVKYKDSPDWCTVEWYGKGTDANGWIVMESTYRGR